MCNWNPLSRQLRDAERVKMAGPGPHGRKFFYAKLQNVQTGEEWTLRGAELQAESKPHHTRSSYIYLRTSPMAVQYLLGYNTSFHTSLQKTTLSWLSLMSLIQRLETLQASYGSPPTSLWLPPERPYFWETSPDHWSPLWRTESAGSLTLTAMNFQCRPFQLESRKWHEGEIRSLNQNKMDAQQKLKREWIGNCFLVTCRW